MSYRRDFTIGLKETQDFYLTLALGRWRKGVLGFAVVGALVGVMYTAQAGIGIPLVVLTAVITAAVAVGIVLLVIVISTIYKVRTQIAKSGKTSYVQETDINGFGVHVTVGKDKAKLGFADLAKVQETGKAFYLFLSDNQAWILPKKQMENPEAESAQLRELFRAVIERGRLKLK